MSELLKDKLQKLKNLENEYFKVFNKCYPTFYDESKGAVFGPSELYKMAIEAEYLLACLGRTAINRMNYLGFDMLFPFNNPVDWFTWKTFIKENSIEHTVYFSISIRLATEIKRMELHLENDAWNEYCELSEHEFSVSKSRYSELFFDEGHEDKENSERSNHAQNVQNIHIGEISYNKKTEEKAVSNLDKLEKGTSIWSNIANAASTIAKATG